jgi:hypothetical protein
MPPHQVQNRTLSPGPQIEKDQCAQVALAFDKVVGARLGLGGVEFELEVQPTELGLRQGGVGLEEADQVLELLLDPCRDVRELLARRLLLPLSKLRFEALDGRLAVRDCLQQR